MSDYIRFDMEAARATIKKRPRPTGEGTLADLSTALAADAKAQDEAQPRANASDDADEPGYFSRFSDFSRGSGVRVTSDDHPPLRPPPPPRDMICPCCRTFSIMRLAQGLECSRCGLVLFPKEDLN